MRARTSPPASPLPAPPASEPSLAVNQPACLLPFPHLPLSPTPTSTPTPTSPPTPLPPPYSCRTCRQRSRRTRTRRPLRRRWGLGAPAWAFWHAAAVARPLAICRVTWAGGTAGQDAVHTPPEQLALAATPPPDPRRTATGPPSSSPGTSLCWSSARAPCPTTPGWTQPASASSAWCSAGEGPGGMWRAQRGWDAATGGLRSRGSPAARCLSRCDWRHRSVPRNLPHHQALLNWACHRGWHMERLTGKWSSAAP